MKYLFSRKTTILTFGLLTLTIGAHAQDDKGRLSGSFETNTIWYIPDSKPEGQRGLKDRFGSNNYLKLDYQYGNFSGGLQFEYYGPALLGFDTNLSKGKIANKYISWSDKGFTVTAGDLYEQFGSGLLLRTYEDRALGFNNSLEGVRVKYDMGGYLNVTGLFGRPRLGMDYLDTWVRGADASVSVSSLLGMENNYLAVEGSYISHYEDLSGDPDYYKSIVGPNMNAWSGRLVFETGFGLSVKGEAVGKGEDAYIVDGLDDPATRKGEAYLVEVGYNSNGLGIFLTGRQLRYMAIQSADGNHSGSQSNALNYLPALTRQYTYMLANLDPYLPRTNHEKGGQVDIYYNFRRGTAVGGRYGMKVHFNAAAFFPLKKWGDGKPYYSDFNLDIERQWNSKIKTGILASVQTYSAAIYNSNQIASSTSAVFVGDVLYRFNRKHSLRCEVQYLMARQKDMADKGDWISALAEYILAPGLSFFVSDMYNYEKEKVHYYSGGVSYARSRTRVALSYGRNRRGYICSGGVCRMQEAYTGANLTITSSF